MWVSRWIPATAVAVTIVVALGVALWWGGGPTEREGWEAAAWVAGVVGALALALAVIHWAMRSPPPPPSSPPSPSPSPEPRPGGVSNSITGEVSAPVIQARDIGEATTYGGDHIDFRGGTFHGTVVGKHERHGPPVPGNRVQPPQPDDEHREER